MAISTRSGPTVVADIERPRSGDLLRRSAEADVPAAAPVVFVVDDEVSIRNSLRRLIASVGFNVEVFPSAQAFLGARRPDAPGCLVLDVRLPGLSGLDLQRELAATDAELPIIFLTGHGDIPMSVRAMKAGAVEFLTKPFREQELLDAIRSAIERDRTMRAERQERAELQRRYASLTPRERDVLVRIVGGLLNKQIAGELGTSEATVKEQRGHVMVKMQAGSVAELVRFAARLGITPAGGGKVPGGEG
jgi:FixJ family two-component response regulator